MIDDMFVSFILTGLQLGLKILGKSCRYMLNSVALRTQPCLTPLEEEKVSHILQLSAILCQTLI